MTAWCEIVGHREPEIQGVSYVIAGNCYRAVRLTGLGLFIYLKISMFNFIVRGILGGQQQHMYFVSIVDTSKYDRFGEPICIKMEGVWAFTETEARQKGAKVLGVTHPREIALLEVKYGG